MDKKGKGRLEEKIFVMHWGWGQRGKGHHSRFSTTELVMSLETLNLEEQKAQFFKVLFYFMFINIFASMHEYLVPMEVKRRHCIPWNWSYR